MNLIDQFLQGQYLRMRCVVNLTLMFIFLLQACCLFNVLHFLLKILQVITQIWVLLIGGLTLAGVLDVWVGTPRHMIHLFLVKITWRVVAKMFLL